MCSIKKCKACFKEKDVSEFHKKGEYSDGRYPRCKFCVKNKVYIPEDNYTQITGLKICSKCKIEKSTALFYKRNNRKSGFSSKCQDCLRAEPKNRDILKYKNLDLMKSYGISLDDYNVILSAQDGCCKICSTPQASLKGKKKYLCVDHCHDTGIIRGLLCDKCNRGIGLLNDSIQLLENAVIYLTPFK